MRELISLTQMSLDEKQDATILFQRALSLSEKYFRLGNGKLFLFKENALMEISSTGENFITNNSNFVKEFSSLKKPIIKKSKSQPKLYAPLYYNGKNHGVILFEKCSIFTDEDLKNAELFSAIVSVMVVHYELREDIEWRFRKLQLLYYISKKLRKTTNIDLLLKTTVNTIREVFKIDKVAILLLSKENKLKIYAATPGYKNREKVIIDVLKGEGITGLAAKKRVPIIVNDVSKNPHYINASESTKSEIAVPLIREKRLLGVLDLESNRKNRFTEDDKKILQAVADEISVAIENALLYEEMKKLAERDELTGLYNYRAFRKELEKEVSRSLRYGKVFSLVMFDIDYFKNYNDNNGHDMGNVVLHSVGSILRKATRKTDFPARFGGEEFIVILPETGKGGALVFAERIRAIIENKHFPGEEKQPDGKLTVSGGVAEFPSDGDTPEKIIKAVDIAAYKAKENGRNRIEIFRKE